MRFQSKKTTFRPGLGWAWILFLSDRCGPERGNSGWLFWTFCEESEWQKHQADEAVTGDGGVDVLRGERKISISENMSAQMLIAHRKSGYSITGETTGGTATQKKTDLRELQASAPQTHWQKKKVWSQLKKKFHCWSPGSFFLISAAVISLCVVLVKRILHGCYRAKGSDLLRT